MIAFGTALADVEAYTRFAGPGVERAKEPDSVVLPFGNPGGTARGGNLVLGAAAELDGLEALVLVDEFTELTDPRTCAAVRAAVADPDVAVAGCMGARDAPTIAWWEGEVSAADVVHRFYDQGGGERPAFDWRQPRPAPMEVDTVDGSLLVFSPWAVRHLRFDEELALPHGTDRDLCFQARAAGRKVVTAPIPVVRHRPLKLIEDLELWVEAHVAVAKKWAEDDQDWKLRARRAEARREAARTVAYSNSSLRETRIAALQAELRAIEDTPSWRLTAPLREVNARIRARRKTP